MSLIRLFFCIFFIFSQTWLVAAADEFNDQNGPRESLNTPLSLTDCENIIIEKSSELAVAVAERAGKMESLQATKKDLYPVLSVWYSYMKELDNAVVIEGFPLNIEDFYSYAISLEQPLYRGRSLITSVELSKLEYQFSGASLAKVRNDLSLIVHEAYYDLLKAQKMEEVARQALLRLQSHRKDAQAFYDAGLIPKNDLLLSEVELAQGEQDLLEAENRTSMAKSVLNVLMKRPIITPLTILDIPSYEPKGILWEEILQKALATRPEITQGEISVQEAEKNVVLTKADYFPTVTLSASYKRQGDTPLADSNPIGSTRVRSAEALAKWRFWSWGQNKNKVAAAKYRLIKANQSVAQVIDTITLEIRQAYLDLKQAEKNINVTDKAIDQAEENYRISKARYQAQLTTSTEVLDAQTLLTQARTNHYNALYDYEVSNAKLDWATGVLGGKQEER